MQIDSHHLVRQVSGLERGMQDSLAYVAQSGGRVSSEASVFNVTAGLRVVDAGPLRARRIGCPKQWTRRIRQ